ncbi:MAG: type II toxin-antitoxin system RelE/ParE family toxin [Rhodocyclaceae bacterium]|nr:type II toxin-antitoxin system RelE/ParE family toxin [Rhodocyclaceae bacterium]
MTWRVIYHDAVAVDLRAIGQAEARVVLNVITQRIQNGEPDKLGKALAGRLAGYRRIRTGSTRIVYRVNTGAVEILIVAVGQRRDAEAYAAAEQRV